MAIEVGAVCRLEPDAEQVGRLVGPLVSMVLRSPVIHGRVDEEPEHWKVLWGGTSAVVDQDPPGRFEYAEHWYHNVAAGERGIDLSLLLMYMTAASIAIVGDGWIIDDARMVGGGKLSGRELSAGDLLARAAGDDLGRSVQDVLAALGSHFWGE
jgi:hypothetical protein